VTDFDESVSGAFGDSVSGAVSIQLVSVIGAAPGADFTKPFRSKFMDKT
jgi:hypothetical protein